MANEKDKPSELETVEEENKKFEDENKRLEANIIVREKLLLRNSLMGRGITTPEPVAKSAEEANKDGAIEFFKGTEIAKMIKKHG